MRKLLIITFILSFSAISFAQTNQPPKPPETVTQTAITDLSSIRLKVRPKITLQRALTLAETYIVKEKIDLSTYYLSEVRQISYGGKDKPEQCWYFLWLNANFALGNYVEIIVSMNTANVSRIPSM